jgi:hypothetical protein
MTDRPSSTRRMLVIGVAFAACSACGGPASDESPPPPQKTVFDPMLQQRDKARELAEKLPQERKENLDRAIDADAN